MNSSFRFIAIAATWSLFLWLSPASAFGCRCVEPTFQRAYALAGAVAVGSVESQERHNDVSIVTFVVERAWKALVPRYIKILTGKACAYPMEAGKRYLLYISKTDEMSFATKRCRGNKPAERAEADLTWLGVNGREFQLPK